MKKFIVFALAALMFIVTSVTADARYRTCPTCDGEGVVHTKVWSDDFKRSVEIEEECPECEGTGEVRVKSRDD